MKKIDKLPDLKWSDRAAVQLAETDADDIIRRSNEIYQIGNYAVAGTIHDNLLAPPWFWFLLGKGVGLRQLIDFRRLQSRIPRGALTAVEKEDAVALRFAEFYGFTKVKEQEKHFIMEKE